MTDYCQDVNFKEVIDLIVGRTDLKKKKVKRKSKTDQKHCEQKRLTLSRIAIRSAAPPQSIVGLISKETTPMLRNATRAYGPQFP